MPQPAARIQPPPLPHRLELLPDELQAHLAAAGVAVSASEARRLVAHRLSRLGERQAERHPVARRLVAAAAAATRSESLTIVERVEDPGDGFVKYLFRSPDGALHEAVRIPLHKPGSFSVCLSSQVGCAMGCTFCATGRLGLTRSLAAWEMIAAFLVVRDQAPGRVTGAVFQGQGEPLQNYDQVMRAAQVLSHPCGAAIAARSITISTVGLVPEIRRYVRERRPYRLIVSLASALDPKRARLLPIAARRPVAELAAAIAEYAAASGTRATVAWVLLGGVNTEAAEVEALGRLLAGVPLRLNLIDVNDPRPGGFVRASDEERSRFLNRLQALGVPVVRRYSGGSARHAACGMLAAVRLATSEPASEISPASRESYAPSTG